MQCLLHGRSPLLDTRAGIELRDEGLDLLLSEISNIMRRFLSQTNRANNELVPSEFLLR